MYQDNLGRSGLTNTDDQILNLGPRKNFGLQNLNLG